MKKYAYQYKENINKNIFNNLLINVSRRTRTLLFQKLPNHRTAPTPSPEPKSALVLHCILADNKLTELNKGTNNA